MQHTITCVATLSSATVAQAWSVWSDLGSYPAWDPREEVNELNGALAVGATGTFKQRGRGAGTYVITQLDEGRSWTTETKLPGGSLVIEHFVEPAKQGVTLTKRYTAIGPMALAFRWFFAAGIRRELPGSFAALEAEIARRFARMSA